MRTLKTWRFYARLQKKAELPNFIHQFQPSFNITRNISEERSMVNISLRFVCFLAAVLFTCSTISLADHHAGFKADLLMQIEQVQKQIMSLQDAVPQEKYGWRPAEGVRSIGEVYNHIAFGNYGLLTFGGYNPPEDAGWSMDPAKWDAGVKDKKGIAARLVKSFDHLKATIAKLTDGDLEKEVDFFGNKMTFRSSLLVSFGHLHEHLGQSIAYARSNGVVPPWTVEQAKAIKEKMEEKK